MVQVLDHKPASRQVIKNKTWSSRRSILLLFILFIGYQLIYSKPLSVTQKDWISKASRHEKNGWIYLHIEGPAY
jgi:hypothetical protein